MQHSAVIGSADCHSLKILLWSISIVSVLLGNQRIQSRMRIPLITRPTFTAVIKRTFQTISSSRKHRNPSADRNQGPILMILHRVLDKSTQNLNLLEISSGTGQHSAYFAEHFPNITFQPSEFDTRMMPSIQAYARDAHHGNIKDPVFIDVSTDYTQWGHGFQAGSFDYMLNINMMHISPWRCSEGLFKNASKVLKSEGLLITYGPYAVNGQLTPESNIRFDASLRSQDPEWGVRDLRDLQELGTKFGILLREAYDMPANNKTIIWVKKG